MENPRLNFITPTLLVGDRSLVDVIKHELAHAWTGNLVTNATWGDFWLNEGWTTYAERRISEVVFGKEYVQLKAAIEREDMLELMGRFGMTSPLTRLDLGQDDLDIRTALTPIQYTKGCEFLNLLEAAAGRQEFDRFIQNYMQEYRFRSITTAEFENFLERELPDAARQVDLERWIHGPGFPESAPPVESRLMEEIDRSLAAYRNGTKPEAAAIADWTTHQIHYFLLKTPKEIPLEDVRYFEAAFKLNNSKNAYLLAPYFELAILSGYTGIYPRVEEFVNTVGRIVFLVRVYRALARAGWSRGSTRRLFESTSQHHHPLTVHAIETILREARL
jgi:hypothetical protein